MLDRIYAIELMGVAQIFFHPGRLSGGFFGTTEGQEGIDNEKDRNYDKQDLVISLPPLACPLSPVHHLSAARHQGHECVYTSPSTSRKHFSNGGKHGKGKGYFTFSLLSSRSSVGGRSLLLPPSSLRSSSQCLLYLLLSSLS